MVSKTRKQRQKKSEALREHGGVLPAAVPSQPKSIHLKKTRPNMKGKKKIRLGLESPVDIYTGFEDRKGVLWRCPTCKKECRVVGYCVDCASGVKSKKHTGLLMSRSATTAASSKKEAKPTVKLTAPYHSVRYKPSRYEAPLMRRLTALISCSCYIFLPLISFKKIRNATVYICTYVFASYFTSCVIEFFRLFLKECCILCFQTSYHQLEQPTSSSCNRLSFRYSILRMNPRTGGEETRAQQAPNSSSVELDSSTVGHAEPEMGLPVGNAEEVPTDPVGNLSDGDGVGEQGSGEEAAEPSRGSDLPLNVKLLLIVSAMSMGFSASIISIFMNQVLEYGPVEITKYWLYVGFTWWTEPFVGIFADSVTLFGERRRPLFLLASAGSIGVYCLFLFKPSVTANFRDFVMVAIAAQLCTIAQYVSLNGVLVDVGRFPGETTQQSTARIASMVSKAMTWRCLGTLVGALMQTCILVHLNVYHTLGLTAGFYVVLIVLILFAPHRLFVHPSTQPRIAAQVLDAIKAVCSLDICDYHSDGCRFIMVLGFVFLYTMMPDSGNVYYNYLYTFHFPTWYYSMLNCFGYCGNTAGSLIFSAWMDRRAKRDANERTQLSTFFVFLVGSLAWAVGYATNIMLCTGFVENTLHIPPIVFASFDNFWSSMCGVLAYVPVILSSTEHAPQGLELSCMQFFSVASMAGGTVSSALTLALLHAHLHDQLWLLILVSIFSRVALVPLAVFLPDRIHETPEAVSLLAAVDEDQLENSPLFETLTARICEKYTLSLTPYTSTMATTRNKQTTKKNAFTFGHLWEHTILRQPPPPNHLLSNSPTLSFSLLVEFLSSQFVTLLSLRRSAFLSQMSSLSERDNAPATPHEPVEPIDEKGEYVPYLPSYLPPGSLSAEEEVEWTYHSTSLPIIIVALLICSTMAQSFASSIIGMFLNITLGFGPLAVTRYWAILGFVSWAEPGIGVLADAFTLFGERRRPLFLVGCVASVIIYCLYCFKPSVTDNWSTFMGVSIVGQVCSMFVYVSLNGLLVDIGRRDSETHQESTARIASIMSKAMFWRSVGTVVGSAIQTYILIYLDIRETLGLSAVFYFILIPLMLFTPRKTLMRRKDMPNIFVRAYEAGKEIKRSFNIHDIRSDGFCFIFVLCFVFLYTMMPDSSTVYWNYIYTYPLSASYFSFVSLCSYVGAACGAYGFAWWMDVRAKREANGGRTTSNFFMFALGSVAWALAYATNIMLCTGFIEYTLHIPPKIFLPIDMFVMQLFTRFAFMPTLAVAAEHAPKAFEATCFEVFAVASLGGGTVSGFLTMFIVADLNMQNYDYHHLWILVLISICCKLIMIPVAALLPNRRISADEANAVEDEDIGIVSTAAEACNDLREMGKDGAQLPVARPTSPQEEEFSRVQWRKADSAARDTAFCLDHDTFVFVLFCFSEIGMGCLVGHPLKSYGKSWTMNDECFIAVVPLLVLWCSRFLKGGEEVWFQLAIIFLAIDQEICAEGMSNMCLCVSLKMCFYTFFFRWFISLWVYRYSSLTFRIEEFGPVCFCPFRMYSFSVKTARMRVPYACPPALSSSTSTSSSHSNTPRVDEEPAAPLNASMFTLRDDIPFRLALLLLFSAAAQSYYAAIISILLNREVGYGPFEITRYWLYFSFSSWISPFVSQRLSIVYLPARHAMTFNVVSTMFISVIFGFLPQSTGNFWILLLLSSYSQLCLAGQYSLLNQYVREAGRREEGETAIEEATRHAKLMSQAMIWRSIGTIIGAVAQCYCLYSTSVRNVVAFAAVLFGLLLPLTQSLPRDVSPLRASGQDSEEKRMLSSFMATLEQLRDVAFRAPHRSPDGSMYILVLSFVFLCTMLPDSGNVYYNYLYSYNFPAWYYSILNGVGYCGGTLGAYFRRSAFSLFALGILCWVMSHACNLLLVREMPIGSSWLPLGSISSMWGATCGSLLISLFSRLAFLPTMVIASEHTPPSFRMISMDVLGLICTVGGTVSALLTYGLLGLLLHNEPQRSERNLLTWTVGICGISKFLLIPFAYFLPSRQSEATEDKAGPKPVAPVRHNDTPLPFSLHVDVVNCGSWEVSDPAEDADDNSANPLQDPVPASESDVFISGDSIQWGDMVFEVPESYAQCALPRSSESSSDTP
eukprot:gene2025-1215_t